MIVKENEAQRLAADVIARGGLLAFRTDTFYGLGADPFNRRALRRINELKGRDDKPILVVISDDAEAERFIAQRTELFEAISERHWPGALTIVVKAKPEVPGELTAASGTVGLRLPDDDEVRAFIRSTGGALTATSANLAGEQPARTAEDVARSFPIGLDLIVDGGRAESLKPSTVLDLSGERVRLIREGAVSRQALEETFQELGLEIQQLQS